MSLAHWLDRLLRHLESATEIEICFYARFPSAPPPSPKPDPPEITSVTFERMSESMAHYSVQASPADPSVTRRDLSVALNGAAPSVVPLDGGFDANDGDTYNLTLTDFAGDTASDPSDPFTGTATGGGPPPPPPPGKPAKPTILGVTLEAPAAPPAGPAPPTV